MAFLSRWYPRPPADGVAIMEGEPLMSGARRRGACAAAGPVGRAAARWTRAHPAQALVMAGLLALLVLVPLCLWAGVPRVPGLAARSLWLKAGIALVVDLVLVIGFIFLVRLAMMPREFLVLWGLQRTIAELQRGAAKPDAPRYFVQLLGSANTDRDGSATDAYSTHTDDTNASDGGGGDDAGGGGAVHYRLVYLDEDGEVKWTGITQTGCEESGDCSFSYDAHANLGAVATLEALVARFPLRLQL